MKLDDGIVKEPWGTAALVVAYAAIYVTQHHRFTNIKQKSYILSTISSGVMSAFSLYFVWIWAMGTSRHDGGHGLVSFDGLLKATVDRTARYGTVLFRSYLMGMYKEIHETRAAL